VNDGWGCVPKKQVDWLNSTLTDLNHRAPQAEIISYIHIPLPEYDVLWNNFSSATTGSKYESVSAPLYNTGLFDVLSLHSRDKPNPISLHVGHDHSNDYCGVIGDSNVQLCYGRKSGYGPYAPVKEIIPGARIMELDFYAGKSTTNTTTSLSSRDDGYSSVWNNYIRNDKNEVEVPIYMTNQLESLSTISFPLRLS
jgi:hypothetical protein